MHINISDSLQYTNQVRFNLIGPVFLDYPDNGSSKLPLNVNSYIPIHMKSYPRRPGSTQTPPTIPSTVRDISAPMAQFAAVRTEGSCELVC
jgi:hypothetical protein